ncbi:hypothetical protein QBC41DRAFT_358881 [Cercophora samala]|uniref:Uncharacterized protein n=1 Tax=Cercophora samala TaxID=330535 RepID=A0AA39Z7X5_9PEZI|nr:hypothetical protein QBC41DRAFT_358881 [Cercophora samala]
MFEQGSGDPFSLPIITRAAVRSSKPVFAEHPKAVASLRASRTSETDPRTGVSVSIAKDGRSKQHSQSSMDAGPELENTVKRNRHSVADLRMAFEQAVLTGSSAKSSASKHPQSKSVSPTKKASSEEAYQPPLGQPNHKHSNSETPKRPRNSDHRQAPATEPIHRRRTRALAAAFEHGGKLKSTPSRPLLQARTLSVKITTIKPAPNDSPTKQSKEKVVARLSESGIGRRVLPGPPPSPFLQHWRTRRETAPVKSGPSLPIMVSTTVAVRTHRDSSSVASSSRRSTPFPAKVEEALRKSRGSSSQYGRLSQDGAGEGPTKDSPVKDRIGLFEHLSRPRTGSSASGSQKSRGSSSKVLKSRNSVRRPSVSELRRGARALRALSLTGRKESKTGDTVVKAAESSSTLPVRTRHSVAVVKQGLLRDDEVPLNSGTAGKPLGSRVLLRANTTAKTDGLSLTPRQDSTFFVKGTMWKVPRTNHAPIKHEEPSSNEAKPRQPSYKPPSSTELVKKTATTKPTLFHPTSARDGRILPDRKSYGALEQKRSWETSTTATAPGAAADPFFDNASAQKTTDPVPVPVPGDGNGFGSNSQHRHQTPPVMKSVVHQATSTISASPTASHYSPGTITPSHSTAELPRPGPTTAAPLKKHHSSLYPSSLGKKAGEGWKNKAGGVGPVLSPDLVHAVKHGGGSRHSSLSWGKRAAAAALGIGRRLKERRASSSAARHSSLLGGSEGGGNLISPRRMMRQGSREGSAAVAGGNRGQEEDWDVVVATPNCRLQHPRPSRVVDWRRWEESESAEEGSGGVDVDVGEGSGEGGGKRVVSVQSQGQRKSSWARL